jgi:hypothetical protein
VTVPVNGREERDAVADLLVPHEVVHLLLSEPPEQQLALGRLDEAGVALAVQRDEQLLLRHEQIGL